MVWFILPGFAIIAACVGASVVGGPIERRWLDRRRRARLEAGPDELPVTVMLSADGRTLGTDAGTLVLVEGWLLFRGERTEWSLRAPGPPGWVYGAPGGPISVSIGASDRNRVERLLDAWQRSPIPEGVPILPPSRPDPELRPFGRRAVAWGLGAFLVTVAAMATIGPTVAATIGGVVALIAALAVRKALRDDAVLLRYRTAGLTDGGGEGLPIPSQESPSLRVPERG